MRYDIESHNIHMPSEVSAVNEIIYVDGGKQERRLVLTGENLRNFLSP